MVEISHFLICINGMNSCYIRWNNFDPFKFTIQANIKYEENIEY